MKRKLLALLSAVCLLLPLQTQAAENNLVTPPYFLENKPTGSVTIPWNADYIVTLAGGAGSSSTGRQGGNGYVVSAKLRLEKGTVLSWTTGGKGAITKAGTTSRGGGQSTLSINGTVVWVAGGGVGATPAYNETARTVTECSMAIVGGESGGRDGYVQYHTCSNSPNAPCYSQVPHTHTRNCPSHQCGKPVGGVGADGHGGACPDGHPNVGFQEGAGYCHFGIIDCSQQWDIAHTCGKNTGQVTAISNATPGRCSGNFTSQSLSNSGAGYCSVKLADRAGLAYDNKVVSLPHYKSTICNLIIRDDTVVYYKRR